MDRSKEPAGPPCTLLAPGALCRLLGAALTGLVLCACQAAPQARLETARGIAAAASMQERDLAAAPFVIRAYERHGAAPGATARVYIEGDGLAWLDPATPSPDPTPTNPVALALAAADTSANVIYLARPCQYEKTPGTACEEAAWTSARFSSAVVAAMGTALDDVKARGGYRSFELVGYSGGAAIAMLVAAERHDVTSVRTVAGDLDTDAFTDLHHLSRLTGSRNPARVANATARIPQVHFIGAKDDIVPAAIYESFRRAAEPTSCIRSRVVAGASHEAGWAAMWPTLLADGPSCQMK